MKKQQRMLGLATFFCLALGGCSAHASFGAGNHSAHRGGPVASNSRPTRAESEPTSDGSRSQPPQQTPPAAIPETPTQQVHAGEDHDRGHGNDADGVDEQNPGKSQRAKQAAANDGQDHDRGHGNDADGVDEDNPGKSKKKKK